IVISNANVLRDGPGIVGCVGPSCFTLPFRILNRLRGGAAGDGRGLRQSGYRVNDRLAGLGVHHVAIISTELAETGRAVAYVDIHAAGLALGNLEVSERAGEALLTG